MIVVDDDQPYLRAVRRRVKSVAHAIDLVTLHSGEQVIDYLAVAPADLVVMDLWMRPGIDGITACLRIRETHSVPVVLVSSHMTPEYQQAALSAGATRTVSKPYDVVSLLRATNMAEPSLAEGTGAVANPVLPTEHIELAHNIAASLAPRYGGLLSRDDIEGLAMLGLCEAAARYDSSRTELFFAFAERRIRGAIIDAIRKLCSQSRGDHRRRDRVLSARRAITESGQEASDARVASTLGITPEQVTRSELPTARNTVSDHDQLDRTPSEVSSASVQLEVHEQGELLEIARQVLGPIEADVIRLRYDAGLSLPTIAEQLRMSENRVAQIHRRALAQLRELIDDADRPAPTAARRPRGRSWGPGVPARSRTRK